MSRLFTSGGQSIEASASASVLPMNIQGLFASELSTHLLGVRAPTFPTALARRTFVGKVSFLIKSLLFNMLSRLVIAFLPRSIF